MEAPDKIYVNFPFGEKHPWRGPMVTKQGLNQHDTVYIRKDALLEWLKELKAQSLKLREEVYGDVFYGAQIAILEETIYKIESL